MALGGAARTAVFGCARVGGHDGEKAMNRYAMLIQERADLVREATELHGRAEREGRGLTDDEKRRDDEIAARMGALRDDIAREERRRAYELALQPVQDGNVAAAAAERGRQADDPRWGFAGMVDFARSVREASRVGGRVDERLHLARAATLDDRRAIGAAPTNYHQEAGSDDGYMVPPAMRAEIWTLVADGEYDDGADLFGMTNPEPTSGNAVAFLKDQSTPWGATGIQAYWRAEAALLTPSRLDTDYELNRLHELYAFVAATEELVADAPLMNARLTRGAAAAIRWKQNEAVMFGTGAGQPLGWMTAGAAVQIAKESGQAAATVVAANVAKMFARVIGVAAAVWLVNQDVLPQLFTMTLGNNTIYFPPSVGFTQAPGGFLLGRPVLISEHCQTLGTAGDIQLVNPRGYYGVRRTGAPEYAESIHLYFDYNVRAFRWVFRLGGQPYLSAAVAPAKGTATRSHFVRIETRS